MILVRLGIWVILGDLDDFGDFGLLWSALAYIDLPWSALAVSDHH